MDTNKSLSDSSDIVDVMTHAKAQGYAATSYADCPYVSGQGVLGVWIEGYVEKCIETGVIPSDTPPYVLGQIAFLQGCEITQIPEGELASGRWVSGWLVQRDKGSRHAGIVNK